MNISGWFIVIIAIFIIFILVVVWYIFAKQSQNRKPDPKINLHQYPIYKLVWDTDFSSPIEQEGKIDYVRWAVPIGNLDESRQDPSGSHNSKNYANQYYNESDNLAIYTDSPNNVRVEPVNNNPEDERHNMIIQATSDKVLIKDNEGVQKYRYSTAQVVSTATFTTGLFIIKAILPTDQEGVWPYIRLHPLENVANHILGSKYGNFPACGEIQMIDPVNHSSYDHNNHDHNNKLNWTGKLIYGGTDPGQMVINPDRQCLGNPSDSPKLFPPIKNHKSMCFGLEWTLDYIAWYLNPRVNLEGKLTGVLLQKIDASEFYTINQNDEIIKGPAPFDVPFHLGIGIEVQDKNGETPPDELVDQIMTIEKIDVYLDARI